MSLTTRHGLNFEVCADWPAGIVLLQSQLQIRG
jgi:hypothetical protein